MTRQVSLWVNGTAISLDYFVSGFIDHTIGGILASLKGVGKVGSLDLSIDEQGDVIINLNNAQVPLNPFVNEITRNTIKGMVSSLKGVSGIDTLKITIKS